MSEVQITATDDGPYLVKGDVKLVGPDGEEIETPSDKPVFALCRCGGSSTKPFCDGTHSKVGFEAAEKARIEYDKSHPSD